MADKKKYFWMRLREDFFESDNMLILESMPDGLIYQNILLKMYCRSIKTNGVLMFNELIPYSPQMLAAVTRSQVGTVEKALEIFEQMKIIEILDNGAIFMNDVQNFIGRSSGEADYKREYRHRINGKKPIEIGKKDICPDICPTEIEKDIDIDKEKEQESVQGTRARTMVQPTREEVKAYAIKNNLKVDADRFFDFYASKGWTVGDNQPMESWQARIKYWDAQDKEKAAKKKPKKGHFEGEREIDYEKLERALVENK